MTIRPHRLGVPIILLFAVAFMVTSGSNLISALQSNMGWVALNHHFSGTSGAHGQLAKAETYFTQAALADADNQSAWFGLGTGQALDHDTDRAVESWRNSSQDPAVFILYGLRARSEAEFDLALAFFHAAERLETETTSEAYFLAGTVCQRALSATAGLSDTHRQFCADYWQENDGNLVVNGSFPSATLHGWGGKHFFAGGNAARLELEPISESAGAVMKLQGLDESNHFGLFQRLALSPGDKVRFSGRFKLEGDDNLSARLLYVGWQTEDGTAQGHHGYLQKERMGWTELERTFTVPKRVGPWFDFYPASFSGKGEVWFDDIQLELVAQ